MRKNHKRTVYDAVKERLDYLFKTFDYIYVSFSGGKDSGVLLNLCIDYLRKNPSPEKKLGVFHFDYEAQYTFTTEYINRVFSSNKDILEIFRVCVPVKVSSCTSMFQQYWRPWKEDKKELWVRPMPCEAYTQSDFNFYHEDMWDYEFQHRFASWLRMRKGIERICCLVGIRTQESYNRWRSIYGSPFSWNGKARWIIRFDEGAYNAYPIYDWLTTDIWTANGRFKWDYNRLYDLYYQAGIPLGKQRVASPFISQAISSLNLYRVIDPQTWGKMLCRVNGVNFAGIYGGTSALGWKRIKLPKGMTWKSYLYFLLDTLPQEARENYLKKLSVSILFWKEKGGCLNEATIRKLRAKNIPIHVEERSNYNTSKRPVRMEYQDDIDLPEFRELPSYKRMCICVLKNDHCCKYMGFSPNKKEVTLRHQAQRIYTSCYKINE